MTARSSIVLVVAGLCLAGIGVAQEKTIEKIPIQHTSAASGPQMYVAYCAACHGKDGKGDGPAASALKVAPTDLTTLAKRNNGKFPRNEVYDAISGQRAIAAHGSKEMPVWGTLFHSIDAHESWSMLRLKNLTDYIETLQVK
ncbi:MAG TPA: c-type cytochrome [Terriglobales bacterium]|nr:c-type cytochrome [Terriglobales bacterium]HXY16417.1 c-type cytochrome [Terriglobales bacterium]